MRCATIIASACKSRTGKERTLAPPATSMAAIASRKSGGFILEGYAIKRSPLNMAGERFDQRIGGENFALLVENQRREAESGERFAGDPRPLELQACRQECAAGEMGTQLIELLDNSAFERSAFGPPRHGETRVFTRRYRNSRGHSPAEALRPIKVAVERFLLQFIGG
jgi:hypothetical protein